MPSSLQKLMLFMFLGALTVTAIAAPPKIKNWKNGRYIQDFGHEYFYVVDTEIQSCFLSLRQGLAVVDCTKLAKRKGWSEIITWVKK